MYITPDQLQKAFELSVISHRGQLRKGNKLPYIIHPFRVVARLLALKEDSVNIFMICCAAILHDVVEDCGVLIEDIARDFGLQVASLVEELTTDTQMLELLGKTQYLSTKMITMSSYAFTIKLCDRLDNVCDMKGLSEEQRLKTIQETKNILHNVVGGRPKISPTQQLIINDIYLELRKYEKFDDE